MKVNEKYDLNNVEVQTQSMTDSVSLCAVLSRYSFTALNLYFTDYWLLKPRCHLQM